VSGNASVLHSAPISQDAPTLRCIAILSEGQKKEAVETGDHCNALATPLQRQHVCPAALVPIDLVLRLLLSAVDVNNTSVDARILCRRCLRPRA
jgi:hypothetical protein